MKALSGSANQRTPAFDLESPKKPDLTESNVKRARLLLEKKKKQFEEKLDQNAVAVDRDHTMTVAAAF